VHGVRLLLSKFDRARSLHDLLSNDVTAFVHLEQQEGGTGICPIAVPEPSDTTAPNEFTDAAFDVEAERIPRFSAFLDPQTGALRATRGKSEDYKQRAISTRS
jgi:hypothetical protein